MAARVELDMGLVVVEDWAACSVDIVDFEGAIAGRVVVETAEAIVVAERIEAAIEVAAGEGSLAVRKG